jgi:hypothetical protein
MQTPRFLHLRFLAARASRLDLVRLWLVSATIALVSFGFAGLIYLMEPPSRPTAERQEATARLPRPRPSEPIVTGSIGRSPEFQSDLASLIAAATPPHKGEGRGRAAADASGRAASARPLTDAEAVDACERKVRAGLAVPSSLSRPSSAAVFRAPSGDPVVSFDADAVNGLGFPLSLSVQCVFADRRLARMETQPR